MPDSRLVLLRIVICLAAAGLLSMASPAKASAAEEELNYLIGRGIRDVTGPAVGMQMWGFVRQGQITEGIHTRLKSRAFVVVDPDSGNRIAFACVDLGSITHELHREVVERLQSRYGDVYSLANVIVSATHTHSGPAGYWHYGADSPLGGAFYDEHFDAIAGGITESIADAHEDLQPGKILLAVGRLEGAGAQRSLPAYMNNPTQERARYDGNTDTEMTLLRFVDATGDIGMLNWFAVHPTSMTYNNKLISGDHKGYAAAAFEREHQATDGKSFVAAFAQSNCGDVTANLNLDNTGPGENEFESTRIIGERQLAKAEELFAAAEIQLKGDIDYRQTFVDFSQLVVRDEYTGTGPQTTSPSAYGYAFAAGSTEDGGGHPLFKEGMKERVANIDNLASTVFRLPQPSDALRESQQPKVILFAPGETKPYPSQAQVQPLGIARLGQLAIIAGPAEFTTMAGRRIREAVAEVLGETASVVVIAGYSNGYAGYVTTREEYETQQYEGGHTLYGPWTQAGYQQEYVQLARAFEEPRPSKSGPLPRDIRSDVKSIALSKAADLPPEGADFGDVTRQPEDSYSPGAKVKAAFWTGDPRNDFKVGNNYLLIQRRDGDEWIDVATDADWETRCRWKPRGSSTKTFEVTIEWAVPADAPVGEYRIVHQGSYRLEDAEQPVAFEAATHTFQVD